MKSKTISELIEEGIKLEAARQSEPLVAKGFSLNWEEANKNYVDWLTLHGIVLLEQLQKANDK